MRWILLLVIVGWSAIASATPVDSLRVETIRGKKYIIHRVDPQETLFALSRRYHTTVDEIKLVNPIADTGIKIGDLLRIPYQGKSEVVEASTSGDDIHVVASGETLFSISQLYNVSVDDIKHENRMSSNSLDIGQKLIIPAPSTGFTSKGNNYTKKKEETFKYHIVMQGETLFSLSKTYNAEVQDIKTWNALVDNNIKLGDTLIVGYTSMAERSPIALSKVSTKEQEPKVSNRQVEEEVEVTRKLRTNEANYEEIVETGLAELIENSGDTKKYLALHKSAKVGTIIRVKNEMNDQEVFVRVVGKLPDTGLNNKILIKISEAAFTRLGAIDRKFRVSISYFPE